MTETAALLATNLPNYHPGTNHYQCSDGQYLLVTAKHLDDPMPHPLAEYIPIREQHAAQGTDVFRADAQGNVLHPEGDSIDHMLPLATFEHGTSHEDALRRLGYTLA